MAGQITVHRTDADLRLFHGFAALGLVAWLIYTRFLSSLQAAHLTLPPCPFFVITGHPCPFCGGTRSYASVWRGDWVAAIRFYPLGPLLFLLTFAVAAYGAWVLISGSNFRAPWGWYRTALKVGVALLAVSWVLKLFWLGN